MKKPAVVLTDRAIKAMKPSEDRREVPDAALPGLYLVVQPSGAMSWAYRYRSPVDTKTRKHTLGKWPAFGLADARKAGGAAARAVAEGRDPAAEKVEARRGAADQADIVNVLLDQFLERHVKPNLRATSALEMERIIDREVRPAWGKRKVGSVTRRDVISLLDSVSARGASTMANRVLALVRKFFNWLIARAVIEASPAAGVEPPSPEKSRDRVLSDDEVRWFWAATEGGGMDAIARLLLLTGQRRGEVAGMAWDELDLKSQEWSIPGKRTKNGTPHVVPLSSGAIDTIDKSLKIADAKLVFTSNGVSEMAGWSKFKATLDARMLKVAQQEAAKLGRDPQTVQLPAWRLHDLRRTAASGMARLGIAVHVVEALLNHKSGTISGIAAVYNRHTYADEKRAAIDAWGNYLDALVHPRADNVIPMKAGA